MQDESRRRLAATRGFLLDLDGTVYVGGDLLPGARRFLRTLAAQKRRCLFLTNNSSRSALDYVEKLRGLGIDASESDILTSGDATAMHLAGEGVRRIFLLGTPSLERAFEDVGFELTAEAPERVVLGFDTTLTYDKLERATRFLRAGVPFVATHPDKVCPTAAGFVPDCGAMISFLETASGVSPLVVGKPQRLMVDMALARLDLKPGSVAAVGDRLYTDMKMGRDAGLLTILVLSGETDRSLLEAADPVAVEIVVENLDELTELLEAAAP